MVVIFGRTGVGISSLVNLILGHPASNDHPDAKTISEKTKSYPATALPGSNKRFCLYEVPGFGGQFPEAKILKTIRQIEREKGIDLFIYCLRKQPMTILPNIVHAIRRDVPGVPMIAVVTELERYGAEPGEMETWWDVSLRDGYTNGTRVEQMCFGEYDRFDAHACITTLPWKEVDLLDGLRKRRDQSEDHIRRLILEQCTKRARRGE